MASRHTGDISTAMQCQASASAPDHKAEGYSGACGAWNPATQEQAAFPSLILFMPHKLVKNKTHTQTHKQTNTPNTCPFGNLRVRLRGSKCTAFKVA